MNGTIRLTENNSGRPDTQTHQITEEKQKEIAVSEVQDISGSNEKEQSGPAEHAASGGIEQITTFNCRVIREIIASLIAKNCLQTPKAAVSVGRR